MSKTWKAVLGVCLIFVLGWLCGTLCTSLFLRHKALDVLKGGSTSVADLLERRLTRTLQLDDNQRQQVHGFFMANLEQRQQVYAPIQPQLQQLNRQTYLQIASILRPEQKERLRNIIKEFRQRYGQGAATLGAETPTTTDSAPTNSGTGQAVP